MKVSFVLVLAMATCAMGINDSTMNDDPASRELMGKGKGKGKGMGGKGKGKGKGKGGKGKGHHDTKHDDPPGRDDYPKEKLSYVIKGHPTHGVNIYNQEETVNLTGLGNWPILFNKVNEIGYYKPHDKESTANSITAHTDRHALLASTSDFIDKVNPDPNFTQYDKDLFNVPISKFGTLNGLTALNIADRIEQTNYEDAPIQSTHRRKGGSIDGITVGDWETVNGVLEFECASDDSETDYELWVAGLVPHGVYTMWNVGAEHPATYNETVAVVPFGGIPNIVIADGNGCAYTSGTLSKCPSRSCLPGVPDCTWYLSLFYHWDNMAYGGSPAAHFFNDVPFHNAPVGVYNGNQVFFPLAKEAELLQHPPDLDFSKCYFDYED